MRILLYLQINLFNQILTLMEYILLKIPRLNFRLIFIFLKKKKIVFANLYSFKTYLFQYHDLLYRKIRRFLKTSLKYLIYDYLINFLNQE
jgi:hypothetical protein